MMRQALSALADSPLAEYLPCTRKSVLRARLHPPVFPNHVQIEPTRRCNLKCLMCTHTNFDYDPQPDMTLDAFKRFLCAFPPGLESIQIQGLGEPLLNRDIVEMIEFARDRGLHTGFNTNLTILTDAVAERLVRCGLSFIQISIETMDPKLFSDLRRGASLEKVLANIEKIGEAKKRKGRDTPAIHVHAILLKHMLDTIPDLVARLKELGVNGVSFIDLTTDGLDDSIRLSDGSALQDMALGATMTEEEIWAAIAEIQKLGDESFSVVTPGGDWGGMLMDRKEPLGVQTCMELWHRPFVTIDGYVTPCCYLPHQSMMNMGNLNEMSFEEIWFGPAYERLRWQHLTNRPPERCAVCQQLAYVFAAPSRIHGRSKAKQRIKECFLSTRSPERAK